MSPSFVGFKLCRPRGRLRSDFRSINGMQITSNLRVGRMATCNACSTRDPQSRFGGTVIWRNSAQRYVRSTDSQIYLRGISFAVSQKYAHSSNIASNMIFAGLRLNV